jgi:hypothetical protein
MVRRLVGGKDPPVVESTWLSSWPFFLFSFSETLFQPAVEVDVPSGTPTDRKSAVVMRRRQNSALTRSSPDHSLVERHAVLPMTLEQLRYLCYRHRTNICHGVFHSLPSRSIQLSGKPTLLDFQCNCACIGGSRGCCCRCCGS